MKPRTGLWLLIGGGVTAAGAALFAAKKASDTTSALQAAINKPAPPAGTTASLPGAPPAGATVAIHATGYWPKSARPDERTMEGGLKDRLGKPLFTLEEFQAGKAPYVSVAGDDSIWPYGQRIAVNAWPGVTFRVVDTGGGFRGINKRFRVVGEEPLDFCVDSSKTFVPKKNVTATIFPGDHFATGGKGRQLLSVEASKFKDQTVSLTGEEARRAAAEIIFGAYYNSLIGEL